MTTRLLRISIALGGLAGMVALPAGTAARAQGRPPARYAVTDLGTLGGANSFAYSINKSGMVSGGANTSGQNDFFAQTAFLWTGGPLISLGTLGGAACPDCSSQGAASTTAGTVAMLSETATDDPNGEDFCEFGTHRQCLAAVWAGGILTALPTLAGGNNAEAFFVNQKGEAVGVSETATPDDTCLTPFQTRQFEAVKWAANGAVMPLAPLGGDTVSFAFTNNDAGQVVGFSGLCSNVTLPPFIPPSAPHAVLWDAAGRPHDLGNPPGGAGNNVAVGINNLGQVTVNSVLVDGTIHAFVWSGGSLHQLATYPSDAFLTVAPCCNNINDLGQIVGFSVDSAFNQHLLFWPNEDAAPLDVNALLPEGSPWYLTSPGGLTAAGEITATAVNLNTGEVHAVVASPVRGVVPARGGIDTAALSGHMQALLRSQRPR